MYTRLSAVLIGAGLFLAPMLSAQAPPKDPATAQDIKDAIAFERNKDAADARQAQREATHPGATKYASNSADRSMDDSSPAVAQTERPAPQSMSQAIAWERFKDTAAARQARLEAKHPSVAYSNANRSADDSTPGNTVKDPGPTVKRDK